MELGNYSNSNEQNESTQTPNSNPSPTNTESQNLYESLSAPVVYKISEKLKSFTSNMSVSTNWSSIHNDTTENKKINGIPNAKLLLSEPFNYLSMKQDNLTSFSEKFIDQTLKNDTSKLKQYLKVKQNIDPYICVKELKDWIELKNKQLYQIGSRTYKKNIFKMVKSELNDVLIEFIVDLQRRNKEKYSPDIVHYFCVSIQKYLNEHNRLDNIFADTNYTEFMSIFNELAEKFTGVYSDTKYIVTEECLWESKLLGFNTPFTLLCTILYFNTLYLNIKTAIDHKKITFKDFKKKKNKNDKEIIDFIQYRIPLMQLNKENMKKRKFEIHRNDENPLRCPVKFFEFYMNKCPEKIRNIEHDFYVLPDINCKPSSPIWFSSSPVGIGMITWIFNRFKMVKEINDIFSKR